MKRHLQDFLGFSTNESQDQGQRAWTANAWVLYYYEDYEPNFLDLYGSEEEAEKAWYKSVLDVFGDQIQEWMEQNLPDSRDLETLEAEDPETHNQLEREGVFWADDNLSYEVQFVFEPLSDIIEGVEGDPAVFDRIYPQMLESPKLDERTKRSIKRIVGMSGMFGSP